MSQFFVAEGVVMNNQKEFKPYIPAEKITPEITVASIVMGVLLSVIFGVDLTGYKMELCIVMLGGGALAYATYFSTVITVIRLQKTLIVCYGIIAIAAMLLSKFFVLGYGIAGAAGMYAFLMTILALILFIIITWGMKYEKN